MSHWGKVCSRQTTFNWLRHDRTIGIYLNPPCRFDIPQFVLAFVRRLKQQNVHLLHAQHRLHSLFSDHFLLCVWLWPVWSGAWKMSAWKIWGDLVSGCFGLPKSWPVIPVIGQLAFESPKSGRVLSYESYPWLEICKVAVAIPQAIAAHCSILSQLIMFQVTLLCLFLFRRTVQFNFAPVKHSSFFMATLLPLQPDCFLSGKIETSCIRLQISPFTKNSPSCPHILWECVKTIQIYCHWYNHMLEGWTFGRLMRIQKSLC